MSPEEEIAVPRASIHPAARTALRAAAALWLALAAGCATDGAEPPRPVALVYLEAGRYQDAAREAELAVRRQPYDPEMRKLAARAHVGAGNLDRALEHLEMAYQQAPTDPEVSVQLGELEQRRENLPDAYVAFRRATELAPDDIRAWSGLALSAEALGFEAEAVDAYARWAELEREQGVEP